MTNAGSMINVYRQNGISTNSADIDCAKVPTHFKLDNDRKHAEWLNEAFE